MRRRSFFSKMISFLLCLCMVASYLPAGILSTGAAENDNYTTVADPETLTRPETIYGNNTMNAGKVTVGKSVSDTDITVNGHEITIDGDNNFLVTISQAAQVMGLTTETSVPVDVVFVLDTSNSMSGTRVNTMVEAANSAIATLMSANDDNRVAVVAFSGSEGGGTSNNAHANVLSYLAHYDGDAATNHIQWVTSRGSTTGSDRTYLQGRGVNAGRRAGTSAGTNIHAGIALGGSLLANVTDTKVNGVTRIPFLVIMSDGAPSLAAGGDWYKPSMTEQVGNVAEVDGLGFMAAMAAAYYKGLITEHYFGSSATSDNRCFVYTMGLGLSQGGLGEMTMDPANAADSNDFYREFEDYWESYENGRDFTVNVRSSGNNRTYTFTAQSIAATKNYVYGTNLGYSGSYRYNDDYFSASEAGELQDAFDDVITEITKKAISIPTKVTTGDNDFDGYVNFYDPIGEYMEVKEIKGIAADGYLYRGDRFAKNLQDYGTNNANEEFDTLLWEMLRIRMGLSKADERFDTDAEADAFITELLAAARASDNQAYYKSADDYDNSIVWWGNVYNTGEEDDDVQMIGFADNDTIEYITDEDTAIPADADYVCRSYFFYGEDGDSNPNPNHQYLYFVIRVQRELKAPYRQTVVISAPASLLSMEKVLITETFDDNGDPVYTASVTHQEPARVIYEVGLWDTITPETVYSVVSSEYAGETVNGAGSVNYDPETDTYNFFTNDWDRSETPESHHRSMAKATFDAAADNAFYTYQQDTLLVDESGKPVTSNPAGTTAYYVREYYEWANDNKKDGTYDAEMKTVLIAVEIPEEANLINKDGQWYIPKGIYTSSTLVVNGDDTVKDDPNTAEEADGNFTGTSFIVAHPHRTGDATNSHYTVVLGNNGMLSLKANTPEPVKTVSVNLAADATKITDDEGKAVKVGDVLTYTVAVQNALPEVSDITVTDYVPLGTAFVAGSAGSGTAETGHTKDPSIVPDSNNVLTWVLEDVPGGETRYVSFQVTVTRAALSLATVSGTIDNTANVYLNGGSAISTNTTHNPPYGKAVTDVNNQDINGGHGFKIGDTLVYHIRVTNNATDSNGNYVAADVTVTDKIPDGTAFVSADNGGSYDATTGVVTWTFKNMAANAAKMVSFQVKITADVNSNDEGTQPESGEICLSNTATIVIGNDPEVTLTTNTTENWVDVGDMILSKTVVAEDNSYNSKGFTISLTESTGLLSGTYVLDRNGSSETVTFENGKASVTISHGEKLTIKGLPAGAVISVKEEVPTGWKETYSANSVTITKGAATTISSVSVTNTYLLTPVTVALKGEKTLTGVNMDSERTFGFIARPDSNNTEVGDPLTGEVTVQATGAYEFTFSPKTFTKPGTYKYTIYEVNGGVLGVTYDETQYTLVITVVDNGNGTMSATATLDGEAFDLASGEVTFENNYIPKETQLEITAYKALSGRDLIAGEFSFQVQLVSKDGTAVTNGDIYKGINDADGNIIFETIAYTAAGTYIYNMTEVVPATASGTITYDTKTYTIVVVVADEYGQLVPHVVVDNIAKTVVNGIVDSGVTFSNSFEPDEIPLVLQASKVLMVYDPATNSYVVSDPVSGKFRFEIMNEDGDVVTIASNDANGVITFNPIYFSVDMVKDAPVVNGIRSKTFTYKISEVVPDLANDPNMCYDTVAQDIEITVSYNTESGALTVSVNGDSDGNVDLTESVKFINYSNPNSVEITPEGKKTTQDAPDGVTFSFSVVNTATNNEAAAGVGDANGNIDFSTMSYSQPGTHTYWIKESNAGNTTNGITYDKTLYLMKVVVSRNEYNRLVAEVTYYSTTVENSTNVADYTTKVDVPSFHNVYNAAGYISLTARKELEGRDLRAGEFAFKLTRKNNGGEIDGIMDADGNITFSTMYYSMNDFADGANTAIIEYTMSEVIPTNAALPGVTYDKNEYSVYIRITNNNDGTIKTELVKPNNNGGYDVISGNDTGVVFKNTYEAVEGDVVRYKIKKNLEGRDLRAGEFEFGLYRDGQLVDVATNDANGVVTFFRTIPATAAAGMYEMVIKESKGTAAGVTYSEREFTIFVNVTDNGNGKIEATVHLSEDGPALLEDENGVVDLTGDIVFTNTYEPKDATYTPEATKELTGRDLIAGEFSFQAQLINQNGTAVTGGKIYSGVNDANGKVIFGTITFTDEGTYIYKITEVSGTISGVSYDKNAYYLKVEVQDNENGHLIAAPTYYSDAACTKSITAVTFKNTYAAADVLIQLEANKELTGRNMNDKEFSFVVYENYVDGKPVATGSNDANGNILFSAFDITAADMDGETKKTFTYVMVESDNKLGGIKYDRAVHTITVRVTDDGTGALRAEITYPTDPLVFRNTYTPTPVTLPLVAYKTLVGKNLQEDEFTFELLDANNDVIQTVKNDADGVIRFEDLEFTEKGTYVYTLVEKNEGKTGYSYDDNVYIVTVAVTDDLRGNLSAAMSIADQNGASQLITFTNSYTPSKISVDLEGTKSIVDPDGNPLTFDPAGFEFEVRDAENNLVKTVSSDSEGKISITGLEFTASGEYRYRINEKTTNKAGYTIDPNVWCVHITIGYNADQGVLTKDDVYIHVAPQTHDNATALASQELEFINTYDPASVSLTLLAKKTLTGRDLRDNEFTFHVVDATTGLIAAEGRNKANGEVSFRLTYTEAGIYNYKIHEHVPEDKLGGVSYTDKVYDVTVTVVDDGSGALKIQLGEEVYTGSVTMDLQTSAVFENTYTPAPVDVTVEAQKRLDGNRMLSAGDFTFELVNADNSEERYTATNDANGKVSFEDLTFSSVGVYTYTISEVKGELPGVTYDETVYTVTITVTDNGHGNLVASTAYTNSNGNTAAPVFANSYLASPVDITPEVKKIFEGGEMRTFSFVLSGEGFDTQIKQNDEEGNATFDTLSFDAPGTYTFTIVEQADPEMDDIRWDTNEYTMVIEVTDNTAIGELEITGLTITSLTGRNDLTFRNVTKDLITDKDVFLNDDLTASIDGKTVEKGDILTYTLSYTNYTGMIADVTITDTIPAFTTLVEGSAEGATYADGVLTWELTGIELNETVTVTFQVVVNGTADDTVENQAQIIEGSNTYDTNVVTNPIEEDTLDKDVFFADDTTISIDGEIVKVGDILEYRITYTNSDDFAADVTITDVIPEYTSYVEGSAEGATYADGVLTWNLTLGAGESVIVGFRVEVVGENVTVINQANALEGENVLTSNVVTNPVPVDEVKKDAFLVSDPEISIDGKTVKVGDILEYRITYTNSYEAAADVTITDVISECVVYVEGSADNGGVYADGVLTWNLTLGAGESVTVSFRVEVVDDDVTVVNQATALEGENEIVTNVVTTSVEKLPEPEKDPEPETKPEKDPEPETKPEKDPEPETKPEKDPEPEIDSIPKTGDAYDPAVMFAVSFGAMALVVSLAVLLLGRKKSELER